MIDRREAESRIRDLALEMWGVAREYGTVGYLTVCVRDDGALKVMFNNMYWDEDQDASRPLNYYEEVGA